jgi:hypothetical protein
MRYRSLSALHAPSACAGAGGTGCGHARSPEPQVVSAAERPPARPSRAFRGRLGRRSLEREEVVDLRARDEPPRAPRRAHARVVRLAQQLARAARGEQLPARCGRGRQRARDVRRYMRGEERVCAACGYALACMYARTRERQHRAGRPRTSCAAPTPGARRRRRALPRARPRATRAPPRCSACRACRGPAR